MRKFIHTSQTGEEYEFALLKENLRITGDDACVYIPISVAEKLKQFLNGEELNEDL